MKIVFHNHFMSMKCNVVERPEKEADYLYHIFTMLWVAKREKLSGLRGRK